MFIENDILQNINFKVIIDKFAAPKSRKILL